MIDCPDFIFESRVVLWATVGPDVRHTGNTKHYDDGGLVGPAAGVAICTGSKNKAFYLFSFDENWDYIALTRHPSIDEAQGQAEFEYEGLTWQRNDATS